MIQLCSSFPPLLTAASFSHDQLSLRVSRLPADWPERPSVRRLMAGLHGVYVADESKLQRYADAEAEERRFQNDIGHPQKREEEVDDHDGLDEEENEEEEEEDWDGEEEMEEEEEEDWDGEEETEDKEGEEKHGEAEEQQDATERQQEEEKEASQERLQQGHDENQQLIARHAKCIAVFSSVACLRLALPLHSQLSAVDISFLPSILNAAYSFPRLTTLLLDGQEEQRLYKGGSIDAIGGSVLQPLAALPSLTALRIGDAFDLRPDCLQLLCELPRLVLLDLHLCTWAYRGYADGQSVVAECSSTLQTLLLPQARGEDPFDKLDIRAPSLRHLTLALSSLRPDARPATPRLSSLTALRFLNAPHTVLPRLHDGLVPLLPNVRQFGFEQWSHLHSDREFGAEAAVTDVMVSAYVDFLHCYAGQLRTLYLKVALNNHNDVLPVLHAAFGCSELRMLHWNYAFVHKLAVMTEHPDLPLLPHLHTLAIHWGWAAAARQ